MSDNSYELKRCPRCGKEEVIEASGDTDTVYAVCPDNHAIRVLKAPAAVLSAMG